MEAMFCHRSEGASWLEDWKELMIKKIIMTFIICIKRFSIYWKIINIQAFIIRSIYDRFDLIFIRI